MSIEEAFKKATLEGDLPKGVGYIVSNQAYLNWKNLTRDLQAIVPSINTESMILADEDKGEKSDELGDIDATSVTLSY